MHLDRNSNIALHEQLSFRVPLPRDPVPFQAHTIPVGVARMLHRYTQATLDRLACCSLGGVRDVNRGKICVA